MYSFGSLSAFSVNHRLKPNINRVWAARHDESFLFVEELSDCQMDSSDYFLTADISSWSFVQAATCSRTSWAIMSLGSVKAKQSI